MTKRKYDAQKQKTDKSSSSAKRHMTKQANQNMKKQAKLKQREARNFVTHDEKILVELRAKDFAGRTLRAERQVDYSSFAKTGLKISPKEASKPDAESTDAVKEQKKQKKKGRGFQAHEKALSLATAVSKTELLLCNGLSAAALVAWMTLLQSFLPLLVGAEAANAPSSFLSAAVVTALVLLTEFAMRLVVFPGKIQQKGWKRSMVEFGSQACSYEVAFRWHEAMK